jgi:hypothetical protein
MTSFTRSWLMGFAAAGALAISTAAIAADELPESLGPVEPNKPILTTVGNKRVLAFYEAKGGGCGMNIMVWDLVDESDKSVARVQMMLNPREVVQIDTPDNKALTLRCGDDARVLAIVKPDSVIAAGAAQ